MKYIITKARGTDHIMHCAELSVGDVIRRGDLFHAENGRLIEMDHLGRLLGVRVLGQTLTKSGYWFRPSPNDQRLVRPLPPSGEADCPQCGDAKSVKRHNADWNCHKCGFREVVDQESEQCILYISGPS